MEILVPLCSASRKFDQEKSRLTPFRAQGALDQILYCLLEGNLPIIVSNFFVILLHLTCSIFVIAA
jgi:hypothetical protein